MSSSAPVSYTAMSGAPSASASPSGAGIGMTGAIGKSSVIVPSSAASAVRIPARVAKRTPPLSRPSLRSACAVARVACPHRRTSTAGVNQRSPHSASGPGSGRVNAVSDRFISSATCCIQASSGQPGPSRTQTAAGLPAKGRSVKASMTRIRMPTTLGPCAAAGQGRLRLAGLTRGRPPRRRRGPGRIGSRARHAGWAPRPRPRPPRSSCSRRRTASASWWPAPPATA